MDLRGGPRRQVGAAFQWDWTRAKNAHDFAKSGKSEMPPANCRMNVCYRIRLGRAAISARVAAAPPRRLPRRFAPRPGRKSTIPFALGLVGKSRKRPRHSRQRRSTGVSSSAGLGYRLLPIAHGGHPIAFHQRGGSGTTAHNSNTPSHCERSAQRSRRLRLGWRRDRKSLCAIVLDQRGLARDCSRDTPQ
jgi:hypothetical protein